MSINFFIKYDKPQKGFELLQTYAKGERSVATDSRTCSSVSSTM